MPIRRTTAIIASIFLACIASNAPGQPAPGGGIAAPDMPDGLLRSLEAGYLTDEERRDLRVNHGIWTEADLEHPPSRARAALIAGVYDDPVFVRDDIDPVDRAEAAYHRGELERSLELLAGESNLRAQRVRAEALYGLGRFAQADAAITPVVNRLLRSSLDDADELVEGVRALVLRARLRGNPAEDYRRMLDLLSIAHQDLDRYSWRAHITEAELLADKNNPGASQEAATEALSLNPALARAWALVGMNATNAFDVPSVERIAERLDGLERRLEADSNAAHVAADTLRARIRMRQRDPDDALSYLEQALARYPDHREALALRAAGESARFEFVITEELLEDFDARSPGSPVALHEVGRALAESRQYDEAEAYLERAIERQPNWPAPHIELGLLRMQTGDDRGAERALDRATSLDPFNERAANSMDLLVELLAFDEVGSEHFVVRYLPGPDEIVALEMLDALEALHAIVSGVFEHVPERRTIIELMPNHELFAVRITGMTGIHTIAAATGPLIAMEVPREGHGHSGPYDWARVVQHEYAHTVTLSRTNNRIPHWFTEAAAVYVEPGPRPFNTCQLLLRALETGTLFDMQEINLAFVRPRTPTDRSQAYAQGHWMYQYIVHEWGEEAPLEMMDLYASGFTELDAMREVLGVTVPEFQEKFIEWARADAKTWGMLPEPSINELRLEETMNDPELRADAIEEVRSIATSFAQRTSGLAGALGSEVELIKVTEDLVDYWMITHPGHPDVLELKLTYEMSRTKGVPDESMVDLLERYALARPVDPMPHRHLATLRRSSEDPSLAVPHLEYLDAREQYQPVYAGELARRYAQLGEWDRATAKATRAVQISPYDGSYRELAATVAIQRGDLEDAEHHIEALTVFEPTIPQHARRLEAIRAMRATRE